MSVYVLFLWLLSFPVFVRNVSKMSKEKRYFLLSEIRKQLLKEYAFRIGKYVCLEQMSIKTLWHYDASGSVTCQHQWNK
ncbi:hypothetical protein EI42_01854 [Thermosporothrix hazakensis]|uniref:Uncharacterized protein n=1 Tax=Thermosporothrix hazakensis TaxID=644383 RepID=A0A326UAC6_THEHA|nr:hypothetical protein EI42_01854 [Thermosporothrix hazakensis]